MKVFLKIVLLFFTVHECCSATTTTAAKSESLTSHSHWKILAHPEVVVPGEETVILLTRNCKSTAEKAVEATGADEDEAANRSPYMEELKEMLPALSSSNDVNTNVVSNSMFGPIEASELIATLTLFDSNKREIFGKIWRVDSNQGLIQTRSRAQNTIFPVPFRIPAHFGDGAGFVEGDTGLVQVRDDQLCPTGPAPQTSQPDWKCPEKCVKDGSCIEIGFRLGSRLRQIVVFTGKTKYQINEQVEIYYQPIDEMTMTKKWPLLTIWIEDATASILYEWRRGQQTSEDTEDWQFFRKITYPLGPKASAGKWRACATTNPWIERSSPMSESQDGSVTNCAEFEVSESAEPEPSFVLSWESRTVPTISSSVVDSGLISEQHFVTLEFGPEMKKTYRRDVPISGRLMSSSSEKEIEVSVQLIDLELKSSGNASLGGPTVLEEQILLLSDEAVFEFAPISSRTNSKSLLIEARLLSVSDQWEIPTEEPESLEITEDEDENETRQNRETDSRHDRVQQSNYLLASMVISADTKEDEKCPLWTRGLQRSFKSGDRATVSVISSCSCEDLGPLHWIVAGRNQLITWGSQDENKKVQSDQLEGDGRRCQYHFNLDITSRMFPSSTFKVWSPTTTTTTTTTPVTSQPDPSGSKLIPNGSENEIEEMAFGLQEMTVSFHDRAMAILELNVTEVSHSNDHVGAEVFAEPYSFICLLGTKLEESSQRSSPQEEDEDNPDQLSFQQASSPQVVHDNSVQQQDNNNNNNNSNITKVKKEAEGVHHQARSNAVGEGVTVSKPEALRPFRVGPTDWFFQCGNASEDGFYSAAFRAPTSGGQWNVEAISVSPLHGLRVSKTKTIRRTRPLDLVLMGIPESAKRNETMRDVTVAIRNNMPVSMQVTIVVTGSSDDIIFSSSNLHYDSSLLNVSAYETVGTNFTINVGHKTGRKNITAHVTGVARLENRLVEMDSVHSTRALKVRSRGEIVRETINDYFCANENVGLTYDESNPEQRFHELPENSEGVTFGIKSTSEIVLSLQGNAFKKSKIFYQIVIGADENTVSWISLVKKGKEQRLQTISTPDILSDDKFKHFWISWKPEDGLLRFGLGSIASVDPILTWPLSQSFKPNRIVVKNLFPGHSYSPNIRFWSLYNEDGAEEVNGRGGGGHNKIFNVDLPHQALNDTVHAAFILSSDFLLPMHGVLFSDSIDRVRPESFNSVVELLRDAATLSISENLGGNLIKSMSGTERKRIVDKLHEAMQDLLYFRNVDGSFGEPLASESFSTALEHFFLLSEIESFFHVSPQLLSSLQRWILAKCDETFSDSNNNNNNKNLDELEARALDILEWAPMESMIFDKYAARAYEVVEKSLKSRLGEGIGILRLTRHAASIVRASGLAAGDYLSPTPANPAFASNANVTDRQRDEDAFVSAILSDMSNRLRDVLNCELEMKEDDLDKEYRQREKDHDIRDLVYALSAFAHAASLDPRSLSFGGNEDRLKEIFECIHTHGNKLLRSPEIGYSVVRSLSEYRLGSRNLLNLPGDRDLKVSIGTGESNGPATTWHVVTSSSSQKKSGKPDFREEIVLDASKQLNKKIYFLATGNGCSTLQLKTEYETFFTNPKESYEVAMDISEDLDEDNLLFFTICIKLPNSSKTASKVPTTVSIEMFSGFQFESLTDLNLMNGNMNEVIPGGWKYVAKNQFLTIYLKEVSSRCGSCFTAKFRRNEVLENLSPGKISIHPTLKSQKDFSTILYFHSAQNRSQLRNGIAGTDWSAWTKEHHTDSNGGVISSQPIPHICPCSLQCDSTTTTTTATATASVSTMTTTKETINATIVSEAVSDLLTSSTSKSSVTSSILESTTSQEIPMTSSTLNLPSSNILSTTTSVEQTKGFATTEEESSASAKLLLLQTTVNDNLATNSQQPTSSTESIEMTSAFAESTAFKNTTVKN